MNFGFLIFPETEELDLVGPWEMASVWNKFLGGPRCLMVAQRPEPVVCAKGMTIVPHATFDDCGPLDYLLVPGGQGTRKEVDNDVLIQFIARQAGNCKEVLSVCTGAFLLHRAGLLAGRRATTHGGSLQRLRDLGDVAVTEERFVKDGPIWTSAGISAGIDLLLAFIASVAGEEAAGRIQFATEYYPSGKIYGKLHHGSDAPQYMRQLP